MVTRRKKVEPTGLDPAQNEAPAQDQTGPAVVAPKKKRAVHKKKPAAPIVDTPTEVSIPVQPHPEIPVAPPIGLPKIPSRTLPVSMKIEPDSFVERDTPARIIPVAEDKAGDQMWRPPRKDKDLSVPPTVLQSPRKYPLDEEAIMDITEDEAHQRASMQDFVRPPVRSGMFRKIGIGFALVALAVMLFVGYVVYAHATVIVYPKTVEMKAARVISISSNPDDGEVGGQVLEVTVAGEKTGTIGSASSAPAAPATPSADADVQYGGTITIHNDTASPITLVPTTRFLTSDGILFRLNDRASVPAKGTTKAKVHADQTGASGAVGPTSFTVPGLPVDKQKVIFGKSDSAMTSIGSKIASGATPTVAGAPEVQASDIDTVESALRDELTSKAKDQLVKSESADWNGSSFLIETMSRFVSTAAGEHANNVTVRLTLRVREVRFDRSRAIASAKDDLTRSLPSGQDLIGVSGDKAVFSIEEADPKTSKASVSLALTGSSAVSLKSPLFDAEKLRGLDPGAVQAYFQGIAGVNKVDVIFRPFWIKRMPDLKDHIEFKIQQ